LKEQSVLCGKFTLDDEIKGFDSVEQMQLILVNGNFQAVHARVQAEEGEMDL
jgi:hypothetical protein